MLLKLNPVGHEHDVLDAYATDYKQQWDVVSADVPKRSFWNWWSVPREYIVKAVAFTLNVLDDLVKKIDQIEEMPADKKATVLRVLSVVLDYVLENALPILLKPWEGAIKDLVINVIASYLIDWIVNKYNEGNWGS